MKVRLQLISYLLVIVFLLHAPSGIEADQCPYLDVTFRSTSEWADFTDIAQFVSIPNEIAINQVITQLSELKGVIDSFKAQYVSDLGSSEKIQIFSM